MSIKNKFPNCPVCGTELQEHELGGLFRFTCPNGLKEDYIKHGYFM